ncbi:guanylate kinase, partial [Patescibacteria group bacterium]|nr:guanylate kinase [Patescibacteria group bacterium]
MSKGLCVVITGSSGAGKTSVVRRLLKQISGSARLITTTSRELRPEEVNGVDYN